MAERDRAAVHVDSGRLDPQLAQHRDHLHRKRFVDLEEIHVLQVPAGFLRDLAHRFDRRHQHQLRRQAAGGLADDSCEGRQAERAGLLRRHHDQRRRAVVDPGRVAGRHAAVLLERGAQPAQRFRRRVGTDRFVAIERYRRAFLLRDLDRDDFVGEPALARRVRGLAMALGGVLILVGAPDLEVLGDVLAGHPHVALLERAPQAIVDHRIDERAVAHAQPLANSREQVRGVAHGFHAAGDGDVDVAGGNALRREHHRLQAGAAHLVDRHRRDVIGQAAVERRLPRRVLSFAGGDHVAHDALVHGAGIDAGAAHRLAHRNRAKRGRGELFQRSEELAGGGPDCGNDDRLTH